MYTIQLTHDGDLGLMIGCEPQPEDAPFTVIRPARRFSVDDIAEFIRNHPIVDKHLGFLIEKA